MPENDREGFGFLYPKKNRQGNQPNVTGNIVWHGETIELAGWTKTAQSSGVKYISLKAQEAGGSADNAEADRAREGADDDIPF